MCAVMSREYGIGALDRNLERFPVDVSGLPVSCNPPFCGVRQETAADCDVEKATGDVMCLGRSGPEGGGGVL